MWLGRDGRPWRDATKGRRGRTSGSSWRLERSIAYRGVRGEDERSKSVRESGFHKSPDRDLDPVARGERVRARRHLANDFLDREQRGVMLEEQVEHAAGRVAHSITGQRYSK